MAGARKRLRLSAGEARRLAIAAQGLAVRRPAEPTRRDVRRIIARQGFLQIDSVNVLVRAHYMPLFSRLGAYDTKLVDRDAYHGRRRQLFEYWAHEASLVPVALHPLLRWRMQAAERGEGIYKGLARFARERRSFVADVLRQIAQRGALPASEIEGGREGSKGWWGWSEAKVATEYLFWAGRLTTARREDAGFTRIYDLPERVLHADVLAAPTPEPDEAQRQLLRLAAAALGVATAGDLRSYFRLPAGDAAARIQELVETGELLPVTVEGWKQQAYLHKDARVPRQVGHAALISPFDPLVSERARAERLFDFHYRIEIYTPAEKRRYGYYCLPFLLGDRIAGRLDLKADRGSLLLRVEAAHCETCVRPEAAAEAMAAELKLMAAWLGLQRIIVEPRGELASSLRSALKHAHI